MRIRDMGCHSCGLCGSRRDAEQHEDGGEHRHQRCRWERRWFVMGRAAQCSIFASGEKWMPKMVSQLRLPLETIKPMNSATPNPILEYEAWVGDNLRGGFIAPLVKFLVKGSTTRVKFCLRIRVKGKFLPTASSVGDHKTHEQCHTKPHFGIWGMGWR
jgi:hypothetical protein